MEAYTIQESIKFSAIIEDSGSIFAEIRWSFEDLREALINAGIDPNQDNLDRILRNRYAKKTLIDVSIQYGWDILSDIITILKQDGLLPPT